MTNLSLLHSCEVLKAIVEARVWANERFAIKGSNLSSMNMPSVFSYKNLDGKTKIGLNYQPIGTRPGERFHIDHGVGIHKNADGLVLWVAPLTGKHLEEFADHRIAFDMYGIATIDDGTQKVSRVKVDSTYVDRPVEIFISRKRVSNFSTIKQFSLLPVEGLEIWGADSPNTGEELLAWDSDELRAKYSGPYNTLAEVKPNSVNKRFQGYSGLMLGCSPMSSYKHWATLDTVKEIMFHE